MTAESPMETLHGRARERLNANLHLLGKLPDGVVAERLGIARKTVVKFRRKNGIPRYQARSSEASATAARSKPVALEAGPSGFVFEIKATRNGVTQRFGVTGSGLIDAATRASEALPGWTIARIRLVAPAL